MSEKIRLELIGITYNQIESGVYALVLRQMGGNRRIPIIIGFPEAQAIECKLQEIATPRPLTHDMTMTILKDFGITLKEVYIHKLPTGIFAADLHLTDGITEHIIDARSSDAIALAIRCDAPIYTNREVLDSSGFESMEESNKDSSIGYTGVKASELHHVSDEELMESMQKAIQEENYEEAARIKAELDDRKKKD